MSFPERLIGGEGREGGESEPMADVGDGLSFGPTPSHAS